MDASRIMRIWLVYVGQGDGILIQLPTDRNYDVFEEDGPAVADERIDILIDGGSYRGSNEDRMLRFVEDLYGADTITIEHAIVTHHDKDHVAGLETILRSDGVGIEHIFHNGLASYRAGARELPDTGKPASRGVFKFNNAANRIQRALGLLGEGSDAFTQRYVMDDLSELRQSEEGDELHGIYDSLAEAVVDKALPFPVKGFHRANDASSFADDVTDGELPEAFDGIELEVLWPPDQLRKYGDWGETINGNSITFRLRYGDFEMLFTGDHNEKSEKVLFDALSDPAASLGADVLKVPHHGSKHNLKAFFDAVGPVVSVASMGPRGAGQSWKHPSPEVIKWCGGAHRFYSTQMHERRFKWEDLTTAASLQAMFETKHILIETDGTWFRVVEVPLDWGDLDSPPTVKATKRGNGTRWIRAR